MRPINLLPEQDRPRAASARPGLGYVALGVLGALLLMVLVYTLTSNQVNSRRGRAVEAKAEAQRLEVQSARLSPFGDFAQVKQARLSAVRDLADVRFDWERYLRELAHVLPAGSWLRESNASMTGNLEGSSTGAGSGSTTTTNTSSATTGGNPAANLVGCTGRQSDVARLLVRLRELHQVQDVQLNESGNDETSGGVVSVDSCGPYYEFDITVTFAPKAPEVPEGARKVPASLGGGS